MGRRSVIAAGALAMSATAVQGVIIHQERYATYYGRGVTAENFFTDANPLISAHPRDRIPSFAPSMAEISYTDIIDFPQQDRPVETRIFTGVIDVTECFDGDYIFRITSDDASHFILDDKVLIDNGGEHGPTNKWAHVKLERGKTYQMQLWWGNVGGGSSLKLEYCRKSATQSATSELMDLIHAGTMGGVDGSLFSDADMALQGCHFTTNIAELFKFQQVPTITRGDFKGYHGDDIKFFENMSDEFLDFKWLPEGHTHEAGGVISMRAEDGGFNSAKDISFMFRFSIAPRVTGTHTFWLEADDGGYLLIDDKVIIDNGGYHAPKWRKASIFLNEGQEYEVKVFYGNAGSTGMLDVMWQDNLAPEPMASFAPILLYKGPK